MNPIMVYCTVPDAQIGRDIATLLVKEGLCACVNQIPGITSYYVYDEVFSEESEELLLIKTDQSHFEALKTRIEAVHPYEVPEIVAVSISHGSENYLQWLSTALKPL